MRHIILVALALWIAALAALATGTINTTGANISAGGSQTPGTVTIDECAEGGEEPSLEPPSINDTLGVITGAMPAFPGAGNGSDGVFARSTDFALNGGTYEHTTYDVTEGATITYTSATTLRVQGDMNIDGAIVIPGNGGGLTIHCGGNFRLFGRDVGNFDNRIATTSGNVVIEVAGQLEAGSVGQNLGITIRSQSNGGVTLRGRLPDEQEGVLQPESHEAAPSVTMDAAVVLADARIDAPGGTVIIQSAQSVEMAGSTTYIGAGTGASPQFLQIQAFGGDLVQEGAVQMQCGFFGDVILEASQSIGFQNGNLSSDGADFTFAAFDGSITLHNTDVQVLNQTNGGVILRANGDVNVTSSLIRTFNGDIIVTAFAGDAGIEPPGHFGGSALATDFGLLRVQASGAVNFNGNGVFISEFGSGTLISPNGAIDVDALTGGIASSGSGTYFTSGANVDLNGVPGITVDSFTFFSIECDSAFLTAGPGGIQTGNFSLTANQGEIDIRSQGTINISNANFSSARELSVVSTDGDILVPNSDFGTFPNFGGTSGSIFLASHEADGFINVPSSSIVSGSMQQGPSGDVSVIVFVGGDPPPVESFFLPKKLTVKLNAGSPDKSSVAAAGFLDTGPNAVDLSDEGSIQIGDYEIPFSGLTPNGPGTLFSVKDPEAGLIFSIKPSKLGSSKAVFKLKRKGDFGSAVNLEQTQLIFENDSIYGVGEVGLTNGKYALGKKRGALKSPNLYLSKCKASIKGSNKDALTLVAGLATNGITPANAPDFGFQFREFNFEVGGNEFTKTGDKFVFVEGGITVTLDYLKETVTVKVKNADLGPLPGGSTTQANILLTLDGTTREVRVRLGVKGKALVY